MPEQTVPPFAEISWGKPKRDKVDKSAKGDKNKARVEQLVTVYINGKAVRQFADSKAADVFAKQLDKQRKAAERELKRTDPASYWRQRCDIAERLLAEAAANLEANVEPLLIGRIKEFRGNRQRTSASKQKRMKSTNRHA